LEDISFLSTIVSSPDRIKRRIWAGDGFGAVLEYIEEPEYGTDRGKSGWCAALFYKSSCICWIF